MAGGQCYAMARTRAAQRRAAHPPLVSSEGQGSSSRVGYIGSCPRRGSELGAAVIREHSDCDETGTEAW